MIAQKVYFGNADEPGRQPVLFRLINCRHDELIKLYALQCGCVGFVIDDAIHDVACFDDIPCHVYVVTAPIKQDLAPSTSPCRLAGR